MIYLNVDIQHTSDEIGNNTDDAFISTITEFYFMSKAKSIVYLTLFPGSTILSCSSGFSLIASLVENIPLYTNNKNEYYYLLNCGNIHQIDYLLS